MNTPPFLISWQRGYSWAQSKAWCIVFHSTLTYPTPLIVLIPLLHRFANSKDTTFQNEQLQLYCWDEKDLTPVIQQHPLLFPLCNLSFWWLWLTIVLLFGFCTIGINYPSTFSCFNQRSESVGTLPLRRDWPGLPCHHQPSGCKADLRGMSHYVYSKDSLVAKHPKNKRIDS